MRDETANEMRHLLSSITGEPKALDKSKVAASLNLLLARADCERLLEEHETRQPETHATVWMLSVDPHAPATIAHSGLARLLPGGTIRLKALRWDGNDIAEYTIDCERERRHSVEWLSTTQWEGVQARLAGVRAERQKATTMPEGYKLIERGGGAIPFGFQSPDGGSNGYWATPEEAHQRAWTHEAAAKVRAAEADKRTEARRLAQQGAGR